MRCLVRGMIQKPERHRCPAHLRFVASLSCIACSAGKLPGEEWMDRGSVSQAHHLLFIQPRARGLKPSDSLTVPLCPKHHDALHRNGDEQAWWHSVGVSRPDVIAAMLWAASVAMGRVKNNERKAA